MDIFSEQMIFSVEYASSTQANYKETQRQGLSLEACWYGCIHKPCLHECPPIVQLFSALLYHEWGMVNSCTATLSEDGPEFIWLFENPHHAVIIVEKKKEKIACHQ